MPEEVAAYALAKRGVWEDHAGGRPRRQAAQESAPCQLLEQLELTHPGLRVRVDDNEMVAVDLDH